MFDFDVGKLMIFAIVALAVIPPKDLPRVMRTVGQAVGKMRRMAAEFQGQFMDAMREADLESVKKEFDAINEQAKVDVAFDPAAMIRDDVTQAVHGPAEVKTSEIALSPAEPVAASADSPAANPPERHEADLDGVRKELEVLNERAKIQAALDPAAMIRDDVAQAVERPAAEPRPPVEAHPQTGPLAAKQSAAE